MNGLGGLGIALIVMVGLALVILIWAITTYNRFVGLRTHIKESWAGIDVELKRRYNLIPNLIETVKGYAKHERETLEAVIAARNRAASNNGSAESQAQDANMLSGALRQLFALAENYPELKADTHFKELQDELSNTEDRIAASRRFYNGNVREYNALRQMFPSTVVAGLFNFDEETFFELDDQAQREAPKVQF